MKIITTKDKDTYIKEYLGHDIWWLFHVYRGANFTDDNIADVLYDQCIISYIERDIIKSFKGE